MRRPPSYSDSYVLMGSAGRPALSPLVLPEPALVDVPTINTDVMVPFYHKIVIFILKGSLHIFFISTFESIFYFLYVSKSEDKGIKGAIDAYYLPLISGCGNWSNVTRLLISDVLSYELNKTTIDKQGQAALLARGSHNEYLVGTSIMYSVVCSFVFFLTVGFAQLKQIRIDWPRLLQEHVAFITLLALYEYFFFRTIIYNYLTITTQELDKYIVDGLYSCSTTS